MWGFQLSDDSSQARRSDRRLPTSTLSPLISRAVIPIQTQTGKSRRSSRLNLPAANIDPIVLLFTTGVIVVAAIVVGLWPGFRVFNNVSMANDLHDNGARGSEGASRQRARSILVVAQVALAVVLLAAAGLTLKSFRRAQEVPLGFNPGGILTMRITEASSRYDSPQKIARFYDQLLEKVKVLPGAKAGANCSDPPFDNNEWDSSFHITGTPPDPPG